MDSTHARMVALMAAMAVYARVFGTRTLQEHVT
jgi:hypothetical protein